MFISALKAKIDTTLKANTQTTLKLFLKRPLKDREPFQLNLSPIFKLIYLYRFL